MQQTAIMGRTAERGIAVYIEFRMRETKAVIWYTDIKNEEIPLKI